jgi:hypothetical protein
MLKKFISQTMVLQFIMDVLNMQSQLSHIGLILT